jgi:hypothetical protein
MLDDLVERYRDQCLWFLRSDYVPTTFREAETVLDLIERYGDRDVFLAVRETRRWLSQNTSSQSSDSSRESENVRANDT